jgi:hypothetical protein
MDAHRAGGLVVDEQELKRRRIGLVFGGQTPY